MTSPAEPPELLPRVGAYLARLPSGVASHPECVARASLLRVSLSERPLAREHVDALPAPVRQLVACPPLDAEWVSDVHLVCVLFAIADAHGMSDEGYLSWIGELNARMFRTTFRHLMTVASPEQLVDQVAERWGVFHRGSSLAVTRQGPGNALVHLAFPPRLFHGLAVRQFAPVWQAALQIADPTSRVDLVASDDVTARFAARWRA
ncbi:hypothetical protein [Anaeromyxobacter oryzae]|uniref:hypothetical protein n=1 Tax=Anaeromyxobacter oryzae TaxID=2918170 RepID=UPI0020BE8D58|nr:hypothetical protein [Anaeromyxobacter oryzae]